MLFILKSERIEQTGGVMNKTILVKLLSLIGMASASTGLGLGMDASKADPWQTAVAVVGLALSWLLAHSGASYYFKVKAFIHEVSDMLDDDKIALQEVKDIINAWKTGKYQPDIAAGKRLKK